jgi:hypothetical protein
MQWKTFFSCKLICEVCKICCYSSLDQITNSQIGRMNWNTILLFSLSLLFSISIISILFHPLQEKLAQPTSKVRGKYNSILLHVNWSQYLGIFFLQWRWNFFPSLSLSCSHYSAQKLIINGHRFAIDISLATPWSLIVCVSVSSTDLFFQLKYKFIYLN